MSWYSWFLVNYRNHCHFWRLPSDEIGVGVWEATKIFLSLLRLKSFLVSGTNEFQFTLNLLFWSYVRAKTIDFFSVWMALLVYTPGSCIPSAFVFIRTETYYDFLACYVLFRMNGYITSNMSTGSDEWLWLHWRYVRMIFLYTTSNALVAGNIWLRKLLLRRYWPELSRRTERSFFS